MQEQLDAIANVYYPIPNIAADGIFGQRTRIRAGDALAVAVLRQDRLPDAGAGQIIVENVIHCLTDGIIDISFVDPFVIERG